MLLDLRTADDETLRTLTRTVVIGSGAAGIALATALEETGTPVVLIESGGRPRDEDDAQRLGALNSGEVADQRYGGLDGARLRRLGGGTQLWLGQCTRLLPLDLADRPWVAGSGWPLGLDELDRWYGPAETFFGIKGGSYGTERWSENPGVAHVPWDGEHLEPDFTEYTDVLRLGSLHLRRLERSSLITVLLRATAVRLIIEEGRVAGVDLRDVGGRRAQLRAQTVVLACGAIENARLLMLSDPSGQGLGTGSRHVGRYLQDHPVIETLEIIPDDPVRFQDRTTTLHGSARRLYPKVRLTPEAQQDHGLSNANACFLHWRTDRRVLAAKRLVAAVKERQVPPSAAKDAALVAGAMPSLAKAAYRRRVHGVSGGPLADRITLQVWMEQPADPESRITLGSTLDPLGLPVARVDWKVGEQEMRSSRALSRWVMDDLQRLGMARVRELPPMHDDEAWRSEVGDAYHPSGTTRMSRRPDEGVVDPDCQVHGVRGLFIAGSSVFPVAGFANPTLTTVALSLRLAAHLARAPHLPAVR